MAISDSIQTLSAAFSFGILLQAAAGALFIYYKGHGPNLFQDGRRLVLVVFLLFAALWAQFSFLNMVIPSTAAGACQAMLVFTTLFDQLARVAVEQFLLWAMGQGTKATAQQMILQGILGLRLIAGGVLVGFTRPQFEPVCVARTSILPTSIVVLALDVVIIGVLLIRASSNGMFGEMRDKNPGTRREQSRALIFTIAGLVVWTGTSVPMILGIPSIILLLRTVLPASGLLILVGILTMFQGGLLLPREDEATTPEARSPFITPAPPAREIFRENINNGSPISGHNYTKSGNLFVVNPSFTPGASPIARIQSGYFQGDTKGFTKLGAETTVRDLGGSETDISISSNTPGYRGSSGIFPSIFATPLQAGNQGAMAPQIRPAVMDRGVPTLAVPAPTVQQKRSLFNRHKTPAKSNVRNLGISKPVLDERNESTQPFARMPTIDLATAAENERERREGAVARSRLVANRPAPQPPSLPPATEGLRKSISVKRKEMPNMEREPMPTIAASNASGLSVDAANGNSTSASLSPGRDEVRRRSPRSMNNFNAFSEKAPNPMAPPLQRKGTIGLPSNPRSQRHTMAREVGMAKEQTVMFINEIVYDDPGMVNTIINTAPSMYASSKRPAIPEISLENSYAPSPRSAHSIIHRPRPFRRDSEHDRAIFPSDYSPRHKRSKSGPSVVGKKSMLMSAIGSPTQLPQLPPLPPPPTSASRLRKLLPNDTKSMTFDEKIELLFPAPPGAPSIRNRRSSVPSLPRLPSVFMSDTPQAQSPTEEYQKSHRASKRTTVASFKMPNIDLANLPKPKQSEDIYRQTYRYSASTYRNLADEVGETWIPGISAAEIDIHNSLVVPPVPEPEPVYNSRQKSTWTETTASISSSNDDATTYWGSLHSEIPPVDLSKARQTAKPTLIEQVENRARTDKSRALPPLPQTEFNDGDEIMTVMLDSGDASHPILSEPVNNRSTFFLDAGQALPGDKSPLPQIVGTWHRRIGDELPTFSERKVQTRYRKMPPPTPLLLNKNGRRQATVVVRNTEPSPLDSPELAIQQIQAQLKRFEETSRGSVGSIIRHLPNGSSPGGNLADDHRLRLLENLEMEMGQQENQWQQMQNNLDRDSVSVVMSPSPLSPVQSEVSRGSSQRASRAASRRLSRRARIRSSITMQFKGEDSTCTTSTLSSDNSRASIWQQRLAEAQVEYLEKAPALLRKRSLNFLSVSKSHQLGSPTPPDSGESGTELETDSESESEMSEILQASVEISPKQPSSLWKPVAALQKFASGRLWNPPHETYVARDVPVPAARDVRPTQRLSGYPLSISSSDLWSKPSSAEHSRPVVGLWGSKLVRPRSIKTRPVTQKPQRKSKRVTFLPDIVESPQPLPNKRETLGIFQFPWGEKSDSAVYQPVFNAALLSGPVVSTKLNARSRELEPDLSEYSESFFDDYDEEMDEESDDDFDETTLWEIASLLQSRDVPSKASLLPPAHQTSQDIVEDYNDESDFDSESEEQDKNFDEARSSTYILPATKFPMQPLAPSPKVQSPIETKELDSTVAASMNGLSQPEESVRSAEAPRQEFMWQRRPEEKEVHISGLFTASKSQTVVRTTTAAPAALNMSKTPRSSTAPLPMIASRSLWSQDINLKQQNEWTSKPITLRGQPSTILMWALEKRKIAVFVTGLFSVDVVRSDYRTSSLVPASISMTCRPRSTRAPLSKLASSELWRRSDKLCVEHHWISESSIRPDSPSIYSDTSSGPSSPASDSSSVKSTSTKASSVWSSISSAASFWESKSAKNSPSRSPVEAPKQLSKIPLRQKSIKALEPVIENARFSKIPKISVPRNLVAANPPVLDSQWKMSRKMTTGTPTPKPVSQNKRTFVHGGNWDEQLAEAIAAGIPKEKELRRPTAISQSKPRLHRIHASPEMWQAALTEAIANGAMITLPALTYDPSIRHPVFFTETMTTTTTQIHPAAIGHSSISRSAPIMWTVPVAVEVPVVAPLWTKKVTSKVEVSLPCASTGEVIRKSPVARTQELPELESSKIWQPTETTVSEHHWLNSTKAKPTQTWASRNFSKSSSEEASSVSLWAAQSPESLGLPEMFAHVRDEYIKKRPTPRTDALPRLQTSELFEPTSRVQSATHWLHTTARVPEMPRSTLKSDIVVQSPISWTPGSAKAQVNKNADQMWESQTKSTVHSPTLFANPHTAPWDQKKKQPTPLKAIESTTLWRPSMAIPASPKNWLVKRAISRVEFRY